MRTLVLLAALASSMIAMAEPKAYAEFALNGLPLKIAEQRFTAGSAELRAGAYVHRLIAIEGFVSGGVLEDDDNRVEASVKSGYGAGLRFESLARDGTKAFILLGYAAHELELTRLSDSRELASDDFDGFAFGVGLEDQLFGKSSNWFLNARWQRYYSAGDIEIDSLGVALRYAF